ncbi:MAG: hypothetical protein AMJ43_01630 [Coxiella sp. DG_40]|nr:MAG: hypothetical protein AMJ43_01630 [Coxiella sp. DG_40]
MNINATLIGEMITFAILVWVTMKYIWPPIQKAMRDREKKIVDGLEAAEHGQKSLQLAEQRAIKQLKEAKAKAGNIIENANMQAAQLVEQGKGKAQQEAKKIFALAQSDVATEAEKVKQQLRSQIATLVLAAAEKVLQESIDAAANQKLIDKFIEEI